MYLSLATEVVWLYYPFFLSPINCIPTKHFLFLSDTKIDLVAIQLVGGIKKKLGTIGKPIQ